MRRFGASRGLGPFENGVAVPLRCAALKRSVNARFPPNDCHPRYRRAAPHVSDRDSRIPSGSIRLLTIAQVLTDRARSLAPRPEQDAVTKALPFTMSWPMQRRAGLTERNRLGFAVER